jgi:hypothetical protein
MIAAVVVVVKSRRTETDPPHASSAGGTGGTPTITPATAPVPEKLVGKWQRTDGDYALDVRRVWPDGRAEVAYANPGPINVSRAEVKEDAGRVVLVVELRDVNYPGSTYTLAYEPGQDALMGTYYQPALGQTYEVEFRRAE